MGLSYSIEYACTVVLTDGHWDVGAWRCLLSRVRARFPLRSATRLILQEQAASFQRAPDELKAVAEVLDDLFGGLSTRIALVADGSEPSQVLEALGQSHRLDLAAFSDGSQAVAWLNE